KNVVEKEPPSLRKINPEVDVDLENIILRCLEKDPARRYATAFDLAEDLERFLNEEPVLARSSGVMYRVRKRVRKNALLTAALVAAVVVLGGGVSLFIRERVDRRRERRQDEATRRDALEAAE